jgi:hypothetical protein
MDDAESSNEEAVDDIILQDSSDDDFETVCAEICASMVEEEENPVPSTKMMFGPIKKEMTSFVVFLYQREIYLGEITAFNEEGATINSMAKSKKYWKWPVRKDEYFMTGLKF